MFEVGQRVKIHGDVTDFTDHLDGMTGTVVKAGSEDCRVMVDDINNFGIGWMIWNRNLTHV